MYHLVSGLSDLFWDVDHIWSASNRVAKVWTPVRTEVWSKPSRFLCFSFIYLFFPVLRIVHILLYYYSLNALFPTFKFISFIFYPLSIALRRLYQKIANPHWTKAFRLQFDTLPRHSKETLDLAMLELPIVKFELSDKLFRHFGCRS